MRSQDKDILVKVDSLLIDDNNNDIYTQCWVGVNLETYTLGKYKTKERALEVLDEIQDIIKPTIITTSYECECKDNPTNKMKFDLEMIPKKTEIQELSTYVYEMPKE